ncbi:raffinose/stachyose/melibiose transport system substrate-binding protein [Arthrobacter sp. PvP102]|uniref:ABC transporter substrate-binding protein n=1 Tax=unclassified Arthrobacter TaxID=235627 RepID=UPI001B6D353F|nr:MULTISPECIES: extracellular solute-binding protein [unclassified Arthrobacter]MBP1235321.1 raffinose/stachyose/melibiose transport system substrate-binding protein [Arthrobacter sp. PvP103]MBP1236280.1 raffinose/stachyose/melibiose transport system substrate-binding protein [Arthrobacter sp. PvP102]
MVSVVSRPKARVLAPVVASVGALALLLTGCGASGDSSAQGSKDFTYLTNVENTTIRGELEALSKDQCKAENEAAPLKVETVPQTSLDQKLQLLAGQNALPVQFAAGNAPALTQDLDKSGNILDFEKALKDLNIPDAILPGAASTIKSLYGGKLNVLPYQYNVEGIWYNKKLFAQNGIEAPKTWDDFVTAGEKLKSAGVTPLSASGKQGWPLTRLVSGYLFSDLGPDALKKVSDGEAKLTDPEYVKAAEAVADLGAKGYFGQGIGSIDYDTAASQFLSGKAGMFYMGSWILSNFNDKAQNKIGEENIGFMPFPKVAGGQGIDNQYAANVGLPMTFNAKKYDDKASAWLKCIATNYGSTALKDKNSISGFKLTTPVDSVPPLVKSTQETVNNTKESVLWFEALFSTKATTTSQTNAAGLVSGSITPQKFMELVQNDLNTK